MRMMEIAELDQVIRWLDEAGIGVLEVTGAEGGFRIAMEPAGAADQRAIPAENASIATHDGRNVVASVLPGVFWDRHPLRTEPLAPEASAVKAGDVIGLIAVGEAYAPVTAPAAGIVTRRLVASGTVVGFGTPLFDMVMPFPAGGAS